MKWKLPKSFTPRRKVAIILASLCLIVAVPLLFPAAIHTEPRRWTPYGVMLGIMLVPWCLAVVLVELFRRLGAAWASLSDEKHFDRVMVLFALLVGVFALGYRLLLERG